MKSVTFLKNLNTKGIIVRLQDYRIRKFDLGLEPMKMPIYR